MADGRDRNLIMVVATSCVAYAFGFLAARFVYLIGLAGFGWIEGREPVLSHSDVVFKAAGPRLAESGGLLAVFGLGIVLALVLPGPGPHGVARLTVLWTMLHLFLAGLQLVIEAPFKADGVAATLAADAGLPDRFIWLLAAVAAAAIVGMAIAAGPFFLKFAPHRNLVEQRAERVRTAALIEGVPWVVGGVVVAVSVLPSPGFLLFVGLSTVLVLTAMSTATATAGVDPRWDPTLPAWPIAPAVLLVILVWLFRFALRPGVSIPPWG
jgi:hypothetical protein